MTEIPGYIAGTWDIDPVHSEVGFTVRHMAVSKVRGRFDTFSGVVVTGEDPLSSTVTASIDATSINTNNADRDAHIKGADFFEVEAHPTWSFTTTGVTSCSTVTCRSGASPSRSRSSWRSTASARTRSAAPGSASRPPARSTATTSASATTGRSPACRAPSSSARRSTSTWRSRPSSGRAKSCGGIPAPVRGRAPGCLTAVQPGRRSSRSAG
jgi:hypothetical protein